MFPKGLAREFERFFAAIVTRLIRKEVDQVIKQIPKDLNFKTDVDKIIPDDGEIPTRVSIRVVDTIIFEIKRRAKKFKRFAESKQFERLVRKKMVGFDKWAKSRIEMSLKRSVREIKFGVSGLKKIGSEGLTKQALTGVELQETGVTAQRLSALVKTNVDLIKTIGRESFPKIENQIKEGLQKGFSNKTIAKNLRNEFDLTESRAKFLARDQTAKAAGTLTKERQVNAGIPGFIWRTQKDNLVRGNPGGEDPDAINPHWDQEGKFFTWEKGWVAPDGRTLFPGDDFNCRCFAEPALGPEQAEKAA